MAITAARLRQLRALVQAGREAEFYSWTEWRHLRLEVLRLDKWECQACRARGRFRSACIVHHVRHLTDRPELALSVWDGDKRQLVSLCKRCHEEAHPESLREFVARKPPVTEERWD